MPITPLDGFATAGIAGQSSTDLNPTPDPLVTGDVPATLLTDELAGADKVLALHTVVGFDASGELVEAVTGSVDPADDVQAIGITAYPVDTTGGAGTEHTPVYRMGCFNPDRINWPATFDTDAKKKAAFEGAPSPTAIILRAPTWANY